MRKILFLLTILVSADAQALFSTKSKSIRCATIGDFKAADTNGSAGPDTDCRRFFCEHVCVSCPGAPEPKELCRKNCTGILLKGPEAEIRDIHNNLAQCAYLGGAASYETAKRAEFGDADTQAFSSAIAPTVEEYKSAVRALEDAIASVNKAQPAVSKARAIIIAEAQKIYPNDPTRSHKLAENLIGLLNAKAQKAAGTYTPRPAATFYTSTRESYY